MSAKQYAKVLRVQRAVRLRRSHCKMTWARAALASGYYDQSHFNKDFRAVAGCAPSELIVEPESFTEAFVTDAITADAVLTEML
ncbi:MAG: helix-turn-helix domain-containing protein [Gemmatimonadales bacterium]